MPGVIWLFKTLDAGNVFIAQIIKLTKFTLNSSYFTHNGKFYKQKKMA